MKKNATDSILKTFENYSMKNPKLIFGGNNGGEDDEDDTEKGKIKLPTQGHEEGND